MQRFLTLLLMLLLPLQTSWAMAANYCGHEVGPEHEVSVQHLGHHVAPDGGNVHAKHPALNADGGDAQSSTNDSGAGYYHDHSGGFIALLLSEPALFGVLSPSQPLRGVYSGFATLSPGQPDRPNWSSPA